jgi:hypothetical protein
MWKAHIMLKNMAARSPRHSRRSQRKGSFHHFAATIGQCPLVRPMVSPE